MYTVDHCLVCDTLDVHKEPAKLAQFVVWKATGEFVYENQDTNGIVCKKCNFVGSQHRFTDEEEGNLYRDYRGEEYTNKRIFCEPDYQLRTNEFNTEQYMQERRIGINTLIERHIDTMKVSTVLDYGGDTGAHIPKKFIKAKHYVSDISGVTTLPGISIFNPRTQQIKFDFVMCCHVLEHKSSLDVLVKELKGCVKDDGWLYVEVPNFDFPLPGGVFHEHINRFNKRSMETLLNKHGLTVIDSMVNPTSGGECLCVLTKLK
jgi:SAM-dependent methyltransferase